MGMYIYAEDLVAVLIGPFNSTAEAEAHIAWCRDVRGDGAEMRVVDEFTANRMEVMETMTPERDMTWNGGQPTGWGRA